MKKIENPLKAGDLAYFHDQKHGDVDSDTGRIYNLMSKEYAERVKYYDKERRIKEQQEKGVEVPEANLKKVVQLVNDAQLEDFCQNDQRQIQLLKLKQEIVKEMLEETSHFIAKYSDIVARHQNPEINTSDGGQTRVTNNERMKIHDDLLDSLEYLNKFLNNNFGLMEPDRMKMFQDNEVRNNRPVAMIKRFEIPKNGIMPDDLNFFDRTDVANWAFDIYGELQRVIGDEDNKKEEE